MEEREIECIRCKQTADSPVTECDNCGGTEYRSFVPGAAAEADEELAGTLAELSSPVNPVGPR
jgi:primosomal protein N'